jgi:hypothetical protein
LALGAGALAILTGGSVAALLHGDRRDRATVVGDVPVTVDFRDVLAQIVQHRLGNDRLDVVFPGYTLKPLGLARAR